MMKKVMSILMVSIMILSLAGCGQTSINQNNGSNLSSNEPVQSNLETDNETLTETLDVLETTLSEEEQVESTVSNKDGKTLVVYFSWSTSGNTEKMATYIQEHTNGDLLEIEPVNPYPTDYEECGDVALVERDNNQRPEIANLPESIEQYDTIFIGYPIWWHTAPMIIGTFLENYDLLGVDVYPFTQSASMNTEQFENSMEFIRESAKGANVHDGLFTPASDTDSILEYLTENGFAE